MLTQQLINAPGADSAANITAADVVGNKTDTVAGNSIVAVSKQVKAKTDLIGTIVNTGGTAELGAALGDFNNITLVSRLNTIDDFLDTEVAAIKVETDQIGTVVNTGGTATLAGALGDVANVSLVSRLDTIDNFLDTEIAAIKTETDQIGTVVNTGGTATLAGALGDVANVSLASRLTTIDDFLDTEIAAIKTETDQIGTVVNTGGTATLGGAFGDFNNVTLVSRLDTIDDFLDTEVAAIKAETDQIGTIVNTGGTATIGGIFGDFANVTLVSRLNTIDDFLDTEIAAIKADTDKIEDATLSAVSTAGSLSRFVASGGTALGTQLPDSKSLYDMVREYGDGYGASKTYADLIGYDTAAAFTVTGDVKVKVIGVVLGTAITSTSGTTTLSLGTTEAPEGIIANSTIDNVQFAATDVWVDATPTVDCEAESATWKIIAGGADIILTRNVDDITAGSLTLYCFWKPLSAGATVVAA